MECTKRERTFGIQNLNSVVLLWRLVTLRKVEKIIRLMTKPERQFGEELVARRSLRVIPLGQGYLAAERGQHMCRGI